MHGLTRHHTNEDAQGNQDQEDDTDDGQDGGQIFPASQARCQPLVDGADHGGKEPGHESSHEKLLDHG